MQNMSALMVPADLALVHDVIVNKSGGVKEFNRASTRQRAQRLPANRLTRKHSHGGPHALAAPRHKLLEDIVEIPAQQSALPSVLEIGFELQVYSGLDFSQIVQERFDAHHQRRIAQGIGKPVRLRGIGFQILSMSLRAARHQTQPQAS